MGPNKSKQPASKQTPKRKNSNTPPAVGIDGEEMKDQRPTVISKELRGLLSRKVEVLPRGAVDGSVKERGSR